MTERPNPRAFAFSGYAPFLSDEGKPYGSFEVFWDDADIPKWGGGPRNFDGDGEPVQPGWYWWACSPGCLPDGEPSGPFNTSREAYNDARSA